MKVLAILFAALLFAGRSLAADPSIHCDYGPVDKTFGDSEWQAYGCSDRTSLIIIAADGNPAAPYYVFLHPFVGKYRLQTVGNPSRAANAAVAQIRLLTTAQLDALVRQTWTTQTPKAKP